jgi:membrane protein DedA with SNARE-associated domain
VTGSALAITVVMLHWIATTVGSLSYFGVALLMAIENIILPLPSELIMPLAGARTNHGSLTLWGVILAGTIGSVIGSYPIFAAAWIYGPERVTEWADRHGKWLLLRRGELQKAHHRFEKRGASAVFISQLLPGVRSLIAIPAGFAHMNVLLFTAANFAGTFVWCSVLAILGRELGTHFGRINKYLGPVGWIALGLVLVGVPTWLYLRKRRRRVAAH